MSVPRYPSGTFPPFFHTEPEKEAVGIDLGCSALNWVERSCVWNFEPCSTAISTCYRQCRLIQELSDVGIDLTRRDAQKCVLANCPSERVSPKGMTGMQPTNHTLTSAAQSSSNTSSTSSPCLRSWWLLWPQTSFPPLGTLGLAKQLTWTTPSVEASHETVLTATIH